MHDLIAFQRDSLYIIAGLGDPRGLAIADELAEYYEKEIQPGRLYPNLDTLVTRGRRELEARREWETQYIELEPSV